MTNNQIEKCERGIRERAIKLNGGNFIGHYQYLSDIEKKILKELEFRSMINSALCYGNGDSIRSTDGTWGEYGKSYGLANFSLKEAIYIWESQRDFFKAHAKVLHNVGSDCEGCIYNSIEWDCD